MDRNKAKLILETCQYELSNQTGSKQCREKYEAIQEAIKALEQPEIIHCGECKHKGTRNCVANALTLAFHTKVKDDFYCGLGKRRTNGKTI